MPVDLKYGRVTVERGTIGDDETVVIFRAQDALLPELLGLYRVLCATHGCPDRHIDAITDAKRAVEAWQRDNPTKNPESLGYTPTTHA